MRKNSLWEYRAIILDLDGMLYFQKPFRARMLRYLLAHAVAHPSSLRDILLIQKYRQVREHWEQYEKDGGDTSLDERQYAFVAEKTGVMPERVKKAVRFFMLEAPLRLLPAYRDERLAAILPALREGGRRVVVYSDYPVEDKLRALGIEADACYTAADSRIGSMKPDPKGIQVILGDLGLAPEEVLMIGDRQEKDGLAAEGNGVDYLILPYRKKERRRLYDSLKLDTKGSI
ncbi:MAG: HAD family hydrolase [Lachnospiraceae bacterium]|nr:HAD family hydrolase [Lachnospiraceae bacterium]